MRLKECRQGSGFSQRALARRAGVAYKTVQLVESGRDCRWSTLVKLSGALGLPGPEALGRDRASKGALSAAQAADHILQDGEESWKTWLFQFVDDFRRAPDRGLATRAPAPELPARALALLASTVESVCAERGTAPPWWCVGVPPLREPWFAAGAESLKASALVQSPAAFRRRNIFVLDNFLSRA